MAVLYPWKMVGRYGNEEIEIEAYGLNEEDCMYKLISLQDKYGPLVWYSGVTDEDYVDGEYIGKSNFIY